MKKTFNACGYTEPFSYVIRPVTPSKFAKLYGLGDITMHVTMEMSSESWKQTTMTTMSASTTSEMFISFLISTTKQPIICLATLKSPAKDSDCAQKQASDDTS